MRIEARRTGAVTDYPGPSAVPCAHNPARSNFLTGEAVCTGSIYLRTKEVEGLKVEFYVCEEHLKIES